MNRTFAASALSLCLCCLSSRAHAEPSAERDPGRPTRDPVAAEEPAIARSTRMRILLAEADGTARRRWTAITMLATTAGFTAPVVHQAIDGSPRSDAEKGFATTLALSSLPYGIPGVIGLIASFVPGPEAQLLARAAAASDGETILRLREDWQREAKDARSMRRFIGIVDLVFAAVNVALATVILVPSVESSYGSGMAAALYIAGAASAGFGAYELSVETPIESSYRTFTSMEDAVAPRASVLRSRGVTGSAAPVAGGAIATVRISF